MTIQKVILAYLVFLMMTAPSFSAAHVAPTQNGKMTQHLIPGSESISTPDVVHSSVYDPINFVSTWNTENIGQSASKQIQLPLIPSGTYNFNVNWGDGNEQVITTSSALHTYSASGTYTIVINGTINGWSFNNAGDKLKIVEISQWGDLRLGNDGSYFYGASNLVLTATDNLNLNGTTTMENAFRDCIHLGSLGSMNGWDVSHITRMDYMFDNATSFNQPLDSWDTTQVTNIRWMFSDVTSFNQPIGSWNVSNVVTLRATFSGATSFNQPLNSWDVSQVIDLSFTLQGCTVFNQPLDTWNVSKVNSMQFLFFQDPVFNQPLNSWDVSNVLDMGYMFSGDTAFNQPLNLWNVGKVTRMSSMFASATNFNQALDTWNVSKVTGMTGMLYGATLSYSNYDNLLVKWSNLPLQSNVVFDAGDSHYSSIGESAKKVILATYSWTISDGGLVSVPDAPQNPSITQDGSNLVISWDGPTLNGGSALINYSVYRSTSSGSGYQFIANTTNFSYTDSSVTQGVTYYYVLSANNIVGASGYSNEVSALVTSSPAQSDTKSNGSSIPILILLPVIGFLGTITILRRRISN